MPHEPLTPEEERQCLHALRLLGVRDSGHQILSSRGFFGLFLSGLSREEMGEESHPSADDFRNLTRLLARAGVDRLKELLDERNSRMVPKIALDGGPPTPTPAPAPATPPRPAPASMRPTAPPPTPSLARQGSNLTPATHDSTSMRMSGMAPKLPVAADPPSGSQRLSGTVRLPSGDGHDPHGNVHPVVIPSAAQLNLPRGFRRDSHDHVPLPQIAAEMKVAEAKLSAPPAPAPAPAAPRHSSGEVPLADPPSSAGGKPRARVSKEIRPVKPTEAALERLKHLERADGPEDCVQRIAEFLHRGFLHDAHHIAAEYLSTHPFDEDILAIAADVINGASHYDRAADIPPFNMLFECEELATIVRRHIPDIARLNEFADAQTARLYTAVKTVYKTWCEHSAALLDYKYRGPDGNYIRRNWVDPRDFGFLLDIMRTAVISKLPLDLLRFVYENIKHCVGIGAAIIQHEDKRARFEAELLRIVASPAKDTVPDLSFQMYRDILEAFRREGDTQSAFRFCEQALLIRRNDKEMLAIKEELLKTGLKKGPTGR